MLGSSALQTVISTASSVDMSLLVSAEWNQNIFNPPYITTAGVADKTLFSSVTPTPLTASGLEVKPGFTTKYFELSQNYGSVSHSVSGLSGAEAYKVVFYAKSNTAYPIILNISAKSGTANQYSTSDGYGSNSVEINSFVWTKVETYIGPGFISGEITGITGFIHTIAATVKTKSSSVISYDTKVYFTEPEIYETTNFDYRYHNLWPTDSVFEAFRPGESYVGTGNSNYSYEGGNFRRVASQVKKADSLSGGFYGTRYMPCSSVFYSPRIATFSKQVDPFLKHGMLSDMSAYKYFVSDETTKIISAAWKPTVSANKIILKFQNIVTSPTVSVKIYASNGTLFQTIAGSPAVNSGVLVLYWANSTWTTQKWTTPPKFNQQGNLNDYFQISSIEVEQTGASINNASNSSYSQAISSSSLTEQEKEAQRTELKRMHLIEISPRVEIDLSEFVKSFQVAKSLSGESDFLPISYIDTNDGSLVLNSIPFTSSTGSPLPIFSNENTTTTNVVSGMLRKNVKFNFAYKVSGAYSVDSYFTSTEYVQAGVLYSDTWEESDASSVSITLFDISRHLQTLPAPDYVAQGRPAMDVIMDILDFAGFTDYDYDSLYTACTNEMSPMDIAYFFCNGREDSVLDVLRKIFVAYQIGAYIDEFGVMRFISLGEILKSTDYDFYIDDNSVSLDGFSFSNKQKPGKISIVYAQPKIKQSASLSNVTNKRVLSSPSYILTTSNDVVWQQQNADSVGFNYLNASITSDNETQFSIDPQSALDIFRAFSVDHIGYAFIENEIVSFEEKSFTISAAGATDETVYVTTNIELQNKISDFVKKNLIFRKDVTVSFNGLITNVKRGLFGTQARPHIVLGDNGATISTKGLTVKDVANTSNTISGDGSTSVTYPNRIAIITT